VSRPSQKTPHVTTTGAVTFGHRGGCGAASGIMTGDASASASSFASPANASIPASGALLSGFAPSNADTYLGGKLHTSYGLEQTCAHAIPLYPMPIVPRPPDAI
jgi:hypothetical protein